MRPAITAAAVAEALTAVDRDADAAGWGMLPVLYALVDPSRDHATVGAVRVPIDDSIWREHQPAIDSGFLPIWAVLSVVVDHFVLDESWQPPLLDSQTLAGFAFGRESWDTSALDDHPGAAPVRVRELTGYDRHGRIYRIVRVRDRDEPTVTVLADQSPQQADLIDECLRRLVAACSVDDPAIAGEPITDGQPWTGEP